jgi:hypothetical protein
MRWPNAQRVEHVPGSIGAPVSVERGRLLLGRIQKGGQIPFEYETATSHHGGREFPSANAFERPSPNGGGMHPQLLCHFTEREAIPQVARHILPRFCGSTYDHARDKVLKEAADRACL